MATIAPGLLRLPLEIWQQIYHYTLVQDFSSRNLYISAIQRRGCYKIHGLETIAGLAFTNHALHSEALSYCFSRFNFHLCNGKESIRFVVREFCRQIGSANQKLVKYISIPKNPASRPCSFTPQTWWLRSLARKRVICSYLRKWKVHSTLLEASLHPRKSILDWI